MHFLLTTTHSKAGNPFQFIANWVNNPRFSAVCLYFDIECIENEESMKKLLLGESHLKTIEACAVCAEDLEKWDLKFNCGDIYFLFADVNAKKHRRSVK